MYACGRVASTARLPTVVGGADVCDCLVCKAIDVCLGRLIEQCQRGSMMRVGAW